MALDETPQPRRTDSLESSVENRREHPRYTTQIQIQGSPSEGGSVARMIASNLSLGGLYCSSSRDYAEMTQLAIRLVLPIEGCKESEGEPVDVEAVVVRRKELEGCNGDKRFELALFFTQVSPESKKRIAHYIAETCS